MLSLMDRRRSKGTIPPMLLLWSYLVAEVLGSTTSQVTLGNTIITGSSQDVGGVSIDFFGGIPYAKPPIDTLRFVPPVLLDTINATTLDATQFGPACAQSSPSGASSEDCLTLNVFRPSGVDADAELPVMAWIYGGGFNSGQTSIYDAHQLIKQSVVRGTPVVYVSINYRVGPFGFPQGVEAAQRGALNLGLKDQRAGLQWIQNHISTFGGDPSKVTIFGESAGAISVGLHLLDLDLGKLARGAIMESGTARAPSLFEPPRRQPAWDTLVSNIPGCADSVENGISIPCAQTASTQDILKALTMTADTFPGVILWQPVIDGPGGLIPDLASKLHEEGKFAKLPFMTGTNLDEGTLFTPTNLSTPDDFLTAFGLADQPFSDPFPSDFLQAMQKIFELYPDDPALGSPFGTGNNTFLAGKEYKRAAAIFGDIVFQAPKRAWLETASAAGVRTFGYLFDDQSAVPLLFPRLGVCHASELTYVYGLEAANNLSPSVRLLSLAMLDYWLSFAVAQTPNDGKGQSKTVWPQYTPEDNNIIQLDSTAFANSSFAEFNIIPDTFRAEEMSFINSVAAAFAE